jgi:hypothetical protein
MFHCVVWNGHSFFTDVELRTVDVRSTSVKKEYHIHTTQWNINSSKLNICQEGIPYPHHTMEQYAHFLQKAHCFATNFHTFTVAVKGRCPDFPFTPTFLYNLYTFVYCWNYNKHFFVIRTCYKLGSKIDKSVENRVVIYAQHWEWNYIIIVVSILTPFDLYFFRPEFPRILVGFVLLDL